MNVLTAEKLGFCFGVERAIRMAQGLLEEGKKVYCLGPIIHNHQVVNHLAGIGLKVVEHLDEIPELGGPAGGEVPTVLIRSHGCSLREREEIGKRNFHIVDATCVLVKRAQDLAQRLFEQGFQVVLLGDPHHPEVKGVMGYAPSITVIRGPEDLGLLPVSGRVAVISQTTRSEEEFDQIVELIKKRNYEELEVVNTICRETALRQASAVELCRQVDVMFVLGGRQSANTGELAELCRRNRVQTYHLEGWHEFESQMVDNKKLAGVTAGASTPDWVIREFVLNLETV